MQMSISDLEDTEFTKRMLRIYEDKNYEDPCVIEDIDNMKIEVNRHASTLVLICILKMLQILLNIIERVDQT